MFTNKHKGLIDFIKKQIGYDLTPVVDVRNSNRRGFTIDWNNIPRDRQRQILDLANKYSWYKVWDNGGLGKFIEVGEF